MNTNLMKTIVGTDSGKKFYVGQYVKFIVEDSDKNIIAILTGHVKSCMAKDKSGEVCIHANVKESSLKL